MYQFQFQCSRIGSKEFCRYTSEVAVHVCFCACLSNKRDDFFIASQLKSSLPRHFLSTFSALGMQASHDRNTVCWLSSHTGTDYMLHGADAVATRAPRRCGQYKFWLLFSTCSSSRCCSFSYLLFSMPCIKLYIHYTLQSHLRVLLLSSKYTVTDVMLRRGDLGVSSR